MTVRVTWKQALAWRMERQLLDPVGTLPVAGVVRRLCGVQTQVASYAELVIRVRRTSSRRGEVARALVEGRLIKTWAMRGTLHLLTPDQGGRSSRSSPPGGCGSARAGSATSGSPRRSWRTSARPSARRSARRRSRVKRSSPR